MPTRPKETPPCSLWLDCEIALEAAPASFLTGVAVRPQVTAARLALDEFRLTRVSDVSGPIVRELGDGLRHVIEDEVNGPKLAAKLNHSIEKRRDQLVFTPEMLLGATTAASEPTCRRPEWTKLGRHGWADAHRGLDGDELFLRQDHVADSQAEFVADFHHFARRDRLVADHELEQLVARLVELDDRTRAPVRGCLAPCAFAIARLHRHRHVRP